LALGRDRPGKPLPESSEGRRIPGLDSDAGQERKRCNVRLRDGNENTVYSRRIPFTDFPLDTV
jgi:hypothetical protein